MAEDKIAVEIEVKGSEESIQSMKDFKAAIKAAKDEQLKAAAAFGEGSDEFVKASKKVSALKDKMDDLNDSTKSLKGSGIERASEGFNQLGEGLRNLDFDKVKVGLVAMKSALAAVGIGLIVQAVMYLVENFDSLSKGSGVLAKVLRGVGDVITTVTDYIYKFTDAIGLTNSELDKMGESVVENANKAKEALASQTAEYDRQIAIAKASGKSAVDLEIAKQQAIIDTNKALVEQTIAYVRNKGVLDEEMKKNLTSQLEAIKNAVTQQQVITLNAEKEKTDINKKANDERLAKEKAHTAKLKKEQESRYNDYIKSQNDELEALKKRLADEQAEKSLARETELSTEQALRDAENTRKLTEAQLKVAQDQADIEAQIALMEQKRQIELQDLTLTQEQRALINQDYANREDALREESVKKAKAQKQTEINTTLNLANQSVQNLQALSDLYFAYKKGSLAKGSAEELKQAKKQFDINKALQISQATIQGVQGVMAAYSSGSAIPVVGAVAGPAFAVLAGVAAAANIAKIASAKFNEGGGAGGSASAVASVAVPAPPTINIPSANTNSSTSFDETGKKVGEDTKTTTPTIKVESTVSVTEINDKQDRVKALETQSTF